MKFYILRAGICVLVLCYLASCRKETVDSPVNIPAVARKVQFVLYTDKDFSNNAKNITFTLSIKNSANQTLWDSTLPVMPLKNIPDLAHKLVMEKTVPNNDPSELRLAFDYYLENVGYSWYVDVFKEKETLKLFEYNFQ